MIFFRRLAKFFLLYCCLIGYGFVDAAHAAISLSVAKGAQEETITLGIPAVSPHHIFTLADPDRLAVDVPALQGHNTIGLPSSYKGGLIHNVRVGWFNPKVSRFVFELAAPIRVTGVEEGKSSLVIHIVKAESAEGTHAEKAVKTDKPQKPKLQKSQKNQKPQKLKIQQDPLIILDPGHGGDDPGTIGPNGVMEKRITLEYAKALKAALLATGHYRVALTRENDHFIMLRQRIAIARKAKADLFISLHADSAPTLARGLSVYTLSESSSDQEAEALASRENKADVLAGVDLTGEQGDVADILISLVQRDTQNNSANLADSLVLCLDDKVMLLPNAHRFAGFAVLKAPDIPSVLVETGFLSHPQEEKLLQSKTHRDVVVKGIVEGIDNYFKQKKEFDNQ